MTTTMPGVGPTVPNVEIKQEKAVAMAATPKMPQPATTQQRVWNTKNLGLRLGADAIAAFSAATLVAPVIAMIDKAIMQNASAQQTIKESLKESTKNLFLRPNKFLLSKPFGLIVLLYGGTYLTANTLDTATSTIQNKPASLVTKGPSKFFASSAANISLTLYKDRTYVKLFGSGGPPRPVPFPCYILFAARDCLTICASFNVAPVLGPLINQNLSKELEKKISGQSIAQFATPAAVQIFSTPVHLLGLDLYNRTGRQISWSDRWSIVKKNWAASTVARMCRIVPAFGVGGVVNMRMRRGLIERFS